MLSKKVKKSFVFSVAIYLILNCAVLILDKHYERKLSKYDINGDGFFSKDERNPEQEEAMRNVTSDTGRSLAPFTLIPASIIAGIAFYFIIRKSSVRG